MRVKTSLAVAVALLSGLGGVAFASLPAQAGDTGRFNGCAAHWRNTAAWDECQDAPGVSVRLQVDCSYEPDYKGEWKYIRGSANPVDRTECTQRANSAWLGFS